MKHKIPLLSVLILAVLLLAACSGGTSAAKLPSRTTNSQNGVVSLVSAPVKQAQATVAAPVTASPEAVAAFQNALENIYAQVNPSVVSIDVTVTGNTAFGSQNNPFGFGNPFGNQFGNQAPSQEALGSGFVWDTQGHIVTNNHVVDGASQITVTFPDGTSVPAKLVGNDPNSDLAVIQVNVPTSELHPVSLMDSSQVKVGQLAIAIGNPFGLSNTMTTGIVSALSRTLPVGLDNPNLQGGPHYSIPDIIQTDASINPGNSGGVLVNDQGQLIGVTAAIQSPSGTNAGIGFVIPSNIVSKVVPALIQTGQYQHPYLGIEGTTLTPQLDQQLNLPTSQKGALVINVTPGGPAANAGLQGTTQQVGANGNQQIVSGGDVIIGINGQPVSSFEDLLSYMYNNAQPGQTVTLNVLRNGQQQNIQITLGVLPNS